jgi:D-amino-acid oxidase
MRALVLGTGVSGLACALRLAEAGFVVEAWDRDDVSREVSSVAAAIWYPYQAGPRESVERWALETLRQLEVLADDPATGVRACDGVEWFPLGVKPADFLHELPQFRELGRRELRSDRARGLAFRVPVIDMETFLPWLRARCVERGVRFVRRAVTSCAEALDACPLVVNCTGLAAREVAHDTELFAIRGQVLRVRGELARDFVIDEHGPEGLCYIVPRGRDVVLGGSATRDREDLAPDDAESAAILARARRHIPALTPADVIEVKVGLRPGRARVRLEREDLGDGRVLIHDYGHGGAGVTLSFGCADEVVRMASRAAGEPAAGGVRAT